MKKDQKKSAHKGNAYIETELYRHIVRKKSSGKGNPGISYMIYLPGIWLDRLGFNLQDKKFLAKIIYLKEHNAIAVIKA